VRAWDLGADVVEIDVRLTRDGIPVLMHDPTPRRTARARRPVRFASCNTLRRARLANDEPIPLLAEALSVMPAELRVAIHLKAPNAGAAAIAEVRNQNVEQRTLLWSEHAATVGYCTNRAPAIEASLLRDTHSRRGLTRFLRDATACGARGVSVHWSAVTPELSERTRERGLALYSWCRETVPAPAKLSLLQGVVTDWPAEARAAMTQLPEVS
jgi:glycerophosphoryl diester phosphodiesterase